MLSDALRNRIAAACVTVVKGDEGTGRGVLVAGRLILTAAHCVMYTTEGQMALMDTFAHNIHTRHGILQASPIAVEPVADIAVLGALDDEGFPDEAIAFQDWCDAGLPVPLCHEDFPVGEPFPVYIYTHRDTWLAGTATQAREEAHRLWLVVPEEIEVGTSGSPVVTAGGEIVGVISVMTAGSAAASDREIEGTMPRPHLTLPAWVLRRLQTWDGPC
jgi:hypothetical protein